MVSKAYAGIGPKPNRGSAVHSKEQHSIIKSGTRYYQFSAKWTVPLRDGVRAVSSTCHEMCQLCEVQS